MNDKSLAYLAEQERSHVKDAQRALATPDECLSIELSWAKRYVELSEQLSSARGEIAALKEGRDKSVALAAHQFREERERAEAAEQERDRLKDKLESFLRDGSRSLNDVAREIVETLRPLDRPGSSEYNITFVRSKLNSVAESRLRDLREAARDVCDQHAEKHPSSCIKRLAALLEGQHG